MDFSIFSALFEQLFHNPACALLVLPISIVAFVLEKWPKFDSKWIPLFCLGAGMLLYPALVKPETVPLTFPHPYVVLVLNGLILGFLAWAVHSGLIKILIDRFAPVDKLTPQAMTDKAIVNLKDQVQANSESIITGSPAPTIIAQIEADKPAAGAAEPKP